MQSFEDGIFTQEARDLARKEQRAEVQCRRRQARAQLLRARAGLLSPVLSLPPRVTRGAADFRTACGMRDLAFHRPSGGSTLSGQGICSLHLRRSSKDAFIFPWGKCAAHQCPCFVLSGTCHLLSSCGALGSVQVASVFESILLDLFHGSVSPWAAGERGYALRPDPGPAQLRVR